MARHLNVDEIPYVGSGHTKDELHGYWWGLVQRWADETVDSRIERLLDVQYYHGKQWTAKEKEILEDRGQPLVTDNIIFDKINFIEGEEDASRTDPQATERTPLHGVDASVAEDAMRSEEERLDLDNELMKLIRDVYRAGEAGLVWGFDEAEDEITAKAVPWDRVIVDPSAREADASDAMFKGILQWRHLEEAARDPYYAGKREILEMSIGNDAIGGLPTQDRPEFAAYTSNRVQEVELYVRQWKVDPKGRVPPRLVWFYGVLTSGGFLIDPIEVPFRTDRDLPWCPLQIVRAYVDENNMPYGYIRNMRSPQDELNKRRSKYLHLLSVRQVALERGAVVNEQEVANEMAKPDGVIVLQQGGLKDGRFQILQTGDLAQGQFQLYLDAKAALDAKGPHAALLNAEIRDISARSFLAQQEAGIKELGGVRTNIRRGKLAAYRALFWMIRQFKRRPWLLRVRDDREGSVRFLPVNQPMTYAQRVMQMIQEEDADPIEAVNLVGGPDLVDALAKVQQNLAMFAQRQRMAIVQQGGEDPGQPEPQKLLMTALQLLLQTGPMQKMFTHRDLSKLDVDITISLAPESTVVEHEEFQTMGELMRHGVQIPPELLVRYSRLRDKRQILEAMKPDPAQVQAQQMQMQLTIEQLQASVQELQARVAERGARAQQIAVDTQIAAAKGQVDVQKASAEAAKTAAEIEVIPAEIGVKHAQALKLSAEAGAVEAADLPSARTGPGSSQRR